MKTTAELLTIIEASWVTEKFKESLKVALSKQDIIKHVNLWNVEISTHELGVLSKVLPSLSILNGLTVRCLGLTGDSTRELVGCLKQLSELHILNLTVSRKVNVEVTSQLTDFIQQKQTLEQITLSLSCEQAVKFHTIINAINENSSIKKVALRIDNVEKGTEQSIVDLIGKDRMEDFSFYCPSLEKKYEIRLLNACKSLHHLKQGCINGKRIEIRKDTNTLHATDIPQLKMMKTVVERLPLANKRDLLLAIRELINATDQTHQEELDEILKDEKIVIFIDSLSDAFLDLAKSLQPYDIAEKDQYLDSDNSSSPLSPTSKA